MSKVGFLFAGQGAQHPGMGAYLEAVSDAVPAVWQLGIRALGQDLRPLLFEGPQEELNRTEITQPAVLLTAFATLVALRQRGVDCTAATGLSLGEYGAWLAAGSLRPEQTLPLVRDRGRFMQEAVPMGTGGMVAVLGLAAAEVEAACDLVNDGLAAVANYNCPGQVVVSGDTAGLAQFEQLARERGAKRLVRLPVSAPFHCSLLKPAERRLASRLEGVEIRPPKFPVYTNRTGQPIAEPSEIRANLIAQVSQPVRFEQALGAMLKAGIDTFVEVGPGTSLGGFVRRIDAEAKVYQTDDQEGFESAVEALKGVYR